MILTPLKISIDSLLLDPNNPRFADISDESLNIPYSRFMEEHIQQNAYNKMLNPKFDVVSLANSIETVGFLPVDNIVAKRLDNNYYVVIEGNRRTTALKYLIKQYRMGQSLMTEAQIEALKALNILVVDNAEDEADSIGKIIQGIRNVSGIKEWEAYQKAQFVSEMVDKGKSPVSISKMIGMSVREVNRYYKTYNAMAQFRRDDEYGSKWKNSHFSYFDEVLKRPALRSFFGWDEDEALFMNEENYRRFYDWITPDDEGIASINDAHEVRALVDLIDEPKALNYLDDRNFQKAITYVELKNQQKSKVTLPECLSRISTAIDAFKSIIGEGLESEMTTEDISEIESSLSEMNKQVVRIKKLKGSES